MMLAEKYANEIQAILAKYPPEQRQAAVMPLLYLAQREQMHVDRASMVESVKSLAFQPPRWPPL